MTVVGAGVIGVEYASMFGALGTKVTVVDQRDRTLGFLDGEIGEAFQYLLRRQQRDVPPAREASRRSSRSAAARGSSWRRARRSSRETVLYAVGRQGATDGLGIEQHRARGRQARADQGRRRTSARRCRTSSRSATSPAAGSPRPRWSRAGSPRCTPSAQPVDPLPELVPTGVYAIPEIGMVGRTEEELTDAVAALRGRHRALDGARPRADDRRRERACSSCSSTRTTAACSAST